MYIQDVLNMMVSVPSCFFRNC